MTVALAVNVGDGVILGADSASTLMNGNTVINWYFNAEKIFNLVKGLPLGVATAGLGGIGGRSITALSKDLRARLTDASNSDWYLDPATYTVELAAQRVKRFFVDELVQQHHGSAPPGGTPTIHFLVTGYSANALQSEVWTVDLDPNAQCTVTCAVTPGVSGSATWRGQGEAIDRLLRGYSSSFYAHLVQLGVSPADAVRILGGLPVPSLIHPAMPIQDVVDLVRYLLEVTSEFLRFAPGPPIVHAPFDLAAITPHEGFRWIQRKHYFQRKLNRPIDRHRSEGSISSGGRA